MIHIFQIGQIQLNFCNFFGFTYLASWHNLLTILSNLACLIQEARSTIVVVQQPPGIKGQGQAGAEECEGQGGSGEDDGRPGVQVKESDARRQWRRKRR